jgi:hypothetical protein
MTATGANHPCDMALARETMGEALSRIGRCALLPA